MMVPDGMGGSTEEELDTTVEDGTGVELGGAGVELGGAGVDDGGAGVDEGGAGVEVGSGGAAPHRPY